MAFVQPFGKNCIDKANMICAEIGVKSCDNVRD